MREIDANFLDALLAAPSQGLIPRKFVWFEERERGTGVPVEIGLWSGNEDISVTVTSAKTGNPVTRTYIGGGSLLGVSDLPRVSDLTVQQIEIDLSQIADAALAIVFEYEARLGKVEIHEMTLDTVSRQPSAQPPYVFYGEIDRISVNLPAVGGEGSMSIQCVSDLVSMLTRTNPAKSSHKQQMRRSNDRWGEFASTIKNWAVVWGEKG